MVLPFAFETMVGPYKIKPNLLSAYPNKLIYKCLFSSFAVGECTFKVSVTEYKRGLMLQDKGSDI